MAKMAWSARSKSSSMKLALIPLVLSCVLSLFIFFFVYLFCLHLQDRAWGDHWDEAIGESRELNPHIPKPDPPKEEEKEEKKEEAEEKKSDDKKEEDKEKVWSF